MNTPEEKSLLRQRINERMQSLSPSERSAESRSVCRRILELMPKNTQTLCAYWPLPSEVDVRPILREWMKRGHPLFLPRFDGKRLTFHRVNDFDDLAMGALNIHEPPADAEPLDPSTLDLALVPGRAFDRSLHRLGRGNGGYDVWIRSQRSANPRTQFWGVAFDCQVTADVPHEAHDERMDAVVTARGFLDVAEEK